MKRIGSFLLLILLACMVSCGTDVKNPADDTEGSIRTDTGGPVVSTDADNTNEMIVFTPDSGKAYTVVFPADADKELSLLVSQFCDLLKSKTGADFIPRSDYYSPDETISAQSHEIIIGDTNREESASLKKSIGDLDGSRYAIRAANGKVVVCATDTYTLWTALDKLLDENVTEVQTGKTALSVPEGYYSVSNKSGRDLIHDFNAAKKEKRELKFKIGKRLVLVRSENNCNVMQGSCTDGKYAYIAMVDMSDRVNQKAMIHKYDLSDWKLVAKSAVLETDHTNDIAYDSVNNRLVINSCIEKTDFHVAHFVDADTLTYIGSKYTDSQFHAIEYLPESNTYIAAVKDTYPIFDSNFKTIRILTGGSTNNVYQGMCSDGTLIYDVRYVKNSAVHYIVVYSLRGVMLGEYPLETLSGEPENIFIMPDGSFCIGFNTNHYMYRVTLECTSWW